MFDGTSQRETLRAFSTFLNMAGPADYHLPSLTGNAKVVLSSKKNSPNWTMRKKSKASWFPNMKVDFQGKSSPPATIYSPNPDRPYPNKQYSSPKDQRFKY